MAKTILYRPHSHELQFTLRAIVIGCLFGSLVIMINLYFGMQTGWTLSGGLITAILSYGVFSLLPTRQPFTVLENTIAETVGAAASTVAASLGAVSVLPALQMLGHPMSWSAMYVWGFATAFIGVYFAIPLRHYLIIHEGLRFPSGTAAAHTIMALHHSERGRDRSAVVLLGMALLGGLLTIAAHYLPFVAKPPIFEYVGLSVLVTWGFYWYASPMLLGAGMIIGPRIGLSLMLGAVIGWGCLGPAVVQSHWATATLFDYQKGVASWVIWPGVALLVSEALMAILIMVVQTLGKWREMLQMFNTIDSGVRWQSWLLGLIACTAFCACCLYIFFDIPVGFSLLAVAMSAVLSMIAGRALGETEINPLTAVGKINQLLFGMLAPGQIITNLLAGGVAAGSAASAGDMLEDWKTGYMLRANPRLQLLAQFIGLGFGVLVCVPAYQLFITLYPVGAAAMPAPSAHAWKAVAELMTQGLQVLPPHALQAMAVASVVGMLLPWLRRLPHIGTFMPSGVAVGIACIVPPAYSMAMFFGSVLLVIWQRVSKVSCTRYVFQVASGLIVGEGLFGMGLAVFDLLIR